jgi:Raf kinase inhibitor-like YbhB/YbcL family protein
VGLFAGAPGRCWRGALASVTAVLLTAGCGLLGGTAQFDDPERMTVTSPDFRQMVTSPDLRQEVMGPEFTCRGAGVHPAIHWSGAPPGTKSLALVMDDSAAPITPYIYWIVFDIGPQTTDIPTGQLPPGARQADNSKGTRGYDPPCPVVKGHAYRFTVYALGKMLQLGAGASAESAWSAIAQEAIARGRLTAVVN